MRCYLSLAVYTCYVSASDGKKSNVFDADLKSADISVDKDQHLPNIQKPEGTYDRGS